MFDFTKFSRDIENLMTGWYEYTAGILSHSTDMGSAREHFVSNVLSTFLPKSTIVGSGEIIDGKGARSGQQDIVLYRSDFPVISSLTPINTYLAEGVIATIEIKSNLSTGSPKNGLLTAFESVRQVTVGKASHFQRH